MNFFNFLARKSSGLPTEESPELKRALTRKPTITAASAKSALFDSPSDLLLALDDHEELLADIKAEKIMNLANRIEREIKPSRMCRDCADDGPRCPHSGELCDPHECAKELSDLVRSLTL